MDARAAGRREGNADIISHCHCYASRNIFLYSFNLQLIVMIKISSPIPQRKQERMKLFFASLFFAISDILIMH